MLQEIISQATEKAQESGKHIQWELDQITKQLTNSQIAEYAREQGWDRLIKLTEKHEAGNYRRDHDANQNLATNQNMVCENIWQLMQR